MPQPFPFFYDGSCYSLLVLFYPIYTYIFLAKDLQPMWVFFDLHSFIVLLPSGDLHLTDRRQCGRSLSGDGCVGYG